MAQMEGLQIYIPQEAEIKRVPLQSLPSSLLQKMGLRVELPEASDCLWICPALFKNKGQKESSPDHGRAKQHMLTLLHSNPTKGTVRTMSFLTANTTAYKLLTDTLPLGSHIQPCSTVRVPQGPLSNSDQDAVIIYLGRIYLSVKRKRQQIPGPAVPQGPAADQSSDHSQMAPVNHGLLKRKLGTPRNTTEGPEPKLSDCGPRGATPQVSLRPGASQRASSSQHSSQGPSPNQCTIQASSGARSDQSQGTSHEAPVKVRAGASVHQKLPEESSDQSSSQAPEMTQKSPHSSTLSWGPSEAPVLPDWGQPEPSAQQQEFVFQELESLERIARIEARLKKSNSELQSGLATD